MAESPTSDTAMETASERSLPSIQVNGLEQSNARENMHRQQSIESPITMPTPTAMPRAARSSDTSSSVADLETWYTKNVATLNASIGVVRKVDVKSVDSKLMRAVPIILKGLEILSDIHPMLKVAVNAFQSVYALDQQRSDNSKKILVVRLQMQDTVVYFFQLRKLDSRHLDKDITILEDLQTLIKEIARDIEDAGSLFDLYNNKGYFNKLLQ